jgi:hypothetical protein
MLAAADRARDRVLARLMSRLHAYLAVERLLDGSIE